MAKLTLTDITAGYGANTTLNANNALIETALENTLSRDGTAPNTMGANLDMNSNKIVNLTDGENNQDAVTVAQLNAARVYGVVGDASSVNITDSGAKYDATTVEGALAELASTTAGQGASIIGINDAGGKLAATDVEAALQEIATEVDTNAANIATNVTGISDNAAAIAVLQANPITKVKSASQSVASSTTLVDDNHLNNFVLAANSTYIIDGQLSYTQNIGDLKFGFTFDQTVASRAYMVFAVAEDGTTDEDTDNAGLDLVLTALTDGQDICARITGILKTSTNAPTAKLQWAQNTSDANNTTLYENSWISFRKV